MLVWGLLSCVAFMLHTFLCVYAFTDPAQPLAFRHMLIRHCHFFWWQSWYAILLWGAWYHTRRPVGDVSAPIDSPRSELFSGCQEHKGGALRAQSLTRHWLRGRGMLSPYQCFESFKNADETLLFAYLIGRLFVTCKNLKVIGWIFFNYVEFFDVTTRQFRSKSTECYDFC